MQIIAYRWTGNTTTWIVRSRRVIMFWLAGETNHAYDRAYAQTTRFELGEAVTRHRLEKIRVVVGIEKGFTNEKYIRHTILKRHPRSQFTIL
jgi:hypothetical protein